MKIIEMRKGEWNKTKAFFSIVTSEGITIKGFKLVNGVKGLFMSMPATYSKKDDKWYDDVWMPEEIKDEVEKLALIEFGDDAVDRTRNEDGPLPF